MRKPTPFRRSNEIETVEVPIPEGAAVGDVVRYEYRPDRFVELLCPPKRGNWGVGALLSPFRMGRGRSWTPEPAASVRVRVRLDLEEALQEIRYANDEAARLGIAKVKAHRSEAINVGDGDRPATANNNHDHDNDNNNNNDNDINNSHTNNNNNDNIINNNKY